MLIGLHRVISAQAEPRSAVFAKTRTRLGPFMTTPAETKRRKRRLPSMDRYTAPTEVCIHRPLVLVALE